MVTLADVSPELWGLAEVRTLAEVAGLFILAIEAEGPQ
jgi:hypothetical protein